MDDAMLFVVASVSVGAVVGAVIGNLKHRAAAGAIWGAALGPIGWLLAGLGPDAAQRKAKRCPYCLGLVPLAQTECAHCNRRLVWVRGQPRKASGQATSISH